MAQLDVSIQEKGMERAIVCGGEIDTSTVVTLEGAFEEAFKAPATAFVVDLSSVGFIDSMGVRALVRFAKACRERAITLRTSPSMQVRRVLDILGLVEVVGAEQPSSGTDGSVASDAD
ncbi:MAG: STAS domain-containing protein [Actinomycetota bacterium]|nr:STAS domain-containing protein [Actinomycetota bacterium]